MKLTHSLLSALALSGSLTLARADGVPGHTPSPRGLPDALKPYDVDDNGKLSREEWQAYVDANKPDRPKNPWDTDGDGKLSEEEIKAAREAIRQRIEERCLKRFDEADTDDDGFLSLDEFTKTLPKDVSAEKAAKVFDRIDTDDDQKISKEEFLKVCGLPPRDGDHPRPPRPPKPVKELPEHLKPFDTNNDGVLSREEIEAAIKAGTWPPRPPKPPLPELLKPFDTNNDGVLSREEIEAAIKAGTWPPKRPGGN